MIEIKTKQTLLNFLSKIKIFLFDCDGTLYTDDTPIKLAKESLEFLNKLNKKIFFATNTSTRSRREYVEKIKKVLKIDFVISEENVLSSSFLTPYYIKNYFPEVKKVYVVGENGIIEECNNFGIETLGGPIDSTKEINEKLALSLSPIELKSIDAIIVGIDKKFNFYKIVFSSLIFQLNSNCKFIATNFDISDRLNDDLTFPGSAPIVKAIESVSNGKKPLIIGKPSVWFIKELILDKFEVKEEEICIVGDRLDTDIKLGIDSKICSLLVLSGVTKNEDLEKKENEKFLPDYKIESVGEIFKLFNENFLN